MSRRVVPLSVSRRRHRRQRRRSNLRRCFEANETGKNHREEEAYPVIHHHLPPPPPHQPRRPCLHRRERGICRVVTTGMRLRLHPRACLRRDRSRFHPRRPRRPLQLGRLLIFQKQNSVGARLAF